MGNKLRARIVGKRLYSGFACRRIRLVAESIALTVMVLISAAGWIFPFFVGYRNYLFDIALNENKSNVEYLTLLESRGIYFYEGSIAIGAHRRTTFSSKTISSGGVVPDLGRVVDRGLRIGISSERFPVILGNSAKSGILGRFGIAYGSLEYGGGADISETATRLRFPIWPIAILCFIIWIVDLGKFIVKVQRRSRGYCCGCGYDLRASKDKCPECGVPISQIETPTSAAVRPLQDE